MATMLVLAGALAQGNNNPGTVAQKIGGALAFRGEMDNVRHDNAQAERKAQDAHDATVAQNQDLASQGQARSATAEYQKSQATVAEQALPSENALRESQANYYDRMPQEHNAQMEMARIGLRTERNKYYGQMLIGAQEGYNRHIQAVLGDAMITDPAVRQKKLAEIQAAYAQQTQAIATLKMMEEKTGNMGYLAYDPKTGAMVPMQLGPGLPSPAAVVPQPGPKEPEAASAAPTKPLRAADLPAAEAADAKKQAEADKTKQAAEKDFQGEYNAIKNWDESRIAATLKRKNLDPVTKRALQQRISEIANDRGKK
ncbi:MAG: hypothetical protein E6R03_03055 [Hyphomicrobiaceae bacterium]|nr:MAG: hypothetical protein E6R03_03055 [Hyphomicrobiaceae bacterium]